MYKSKVTNNIYKVVSGSVYILPFNKDKWEICSSINEHTLIFNNCFKEIEDIS